MLSSIAEIIRDLLIFVVAMAALLITLVVVISKMPDSNPLRRLLTALSYRLGATLAAGAVAVPLEPIPGIDTLYDIGDPIAHMCVSWFSLSVGLPDWRVDDDLRQWAFSVDRHRSLYATVEAI
jgi:hypothetical protein